MEAKFFKLLNLKCHTLFTNLINAITKFFHIIEYIACLWLHLKKERPKITFISTYVAILLLLIETNESWKPLSTLFKSLEKSPYQACHFNGNIIRSRTKMFGKNTYQSY